MNTEAVPIGILTRNRAVYLNFTLRSLSATNLPVGIVPQLFDDSSDCPIALSYLYSDNLIRISNVPASVQKFIPSITITPMVAGIKQRLKVFRTPVHLGVVHASAFALDHLVTHSRAEYVCLLQDDVLFEVEWYTKLLKIAMVHGPGVLAGMSFECAPIQDGHASIGSSVQKCAFAQAQCLFISRGVAEHFARDIAKRFSRANRGFDTILCHFARRIGASVMVAIPNVCQHFGNDSLVHPGRTFERKGGRYSHRVGAHLELSEEIIWNSLTRNVPAS